MTLRITSLVCACSFLLTSASQGQTRVSQFTILPGSTYTYLPSGFGPIPDCDPTDDLQCDFQLTGTFEVVEDFSNGTATIVDADLTIDSGVTPNPPLTLLTAEGVEEFLESIVWEQQPSVTIVASYKPLPGSLPGVTNDLMLTFDTPGAGGSLTGGYDQRPVDGDGVVFNANLRRIPEPASALLAALPIGFATRRRRLLA